MQTDAGNDCVHFPGRCNEHRASENRNAGPVECKALLALMQREIALSAVAWLAQCLQILYYRLPA
jgi:hypothetical protein